MKLRLATILLMLALAAAALYVGVKGYIYFSVKAKVDDAVVMASPYAELRYGGISSDLRGSVTLEDISVAPLAAPEAIRVASARLTGPDLGFLLDMGGSFREGKPPEHLSIELLGMAIPADMQLPAQFDGPPGVPSQAGSTKKHDPCSLPGLLHFTAGSGDADGEPLVVDARVGYELTGEGEGAGVFMGYDVRGYNSLAVEFNMDNPAQAASIMFGAMPSLGRMSVTFAANKDNLARAVQYCAQKHDQPPQEFLRGLMQRDDAHYMGTLGFVPGPGMRDALAQFLANPGEIQITAYPSASFNQQALSQYSPQDIVSLLDLNVRVNGSIVNDLRFSVPDISPSDVTGPAALARLLKNRQRKDQDTRRQTRSRKTTKPRPLKEYLPTPVEELVKHVGTDVRLHTTQSEKTRNGLLLSVESGVAAVEHKVHRGKLTYYVPLAQIKQADVYRFPETSAD